MPSPLDNQKYFCGGLLQKKRECSLCTENADAVRVLLERSAPRTRELYCSPLITAIEWSSIDCVVNLVLQVSFTSISNRKTKRAFLPDIIFIMVGWLVNFMLLRLNEQAKMPFRQ